MVKKLWYIHLMESYEAVKKNKVRVLSGELSETSEKGIGA